MAEKAGAICSKPAYGRFCRIRHRIRTSCRHAPEIELLPETADDLPSRILLMTGLSKP